MHFTSTPRTAGTGDPRATPRGEAAAHLLSGRQQAHLADGLAGIMMSKGLQVPSRTSISEHVPVNTQRAVAARARTQRKKNRSHLEALLRQMDWGGQKRSA